MKTLRNISFNELKSKIEEYLSTLCEFGLQIKNVNEEGKSVCDNLLKLKSLYVNKSITKENLSVVWPKIMSSLILLNPYFQHKVASYCMIYMKLVQGGFDYFKPIVGEQDSIQNVIQSSNNLIYGSYTESHLNALINLHIRSTEKIEFNLIKSVKLLPSIDQFDLEEIFSVCCKVEKGTQFRTRSRALRDAFSHSKYKIEEKQGIISIKIDNNKDGYDLHCKYTLDEFSNFMSLQRKLYILFVNISYLFYLRNLILHYFERLSNMHK